MLLLLSQPEVYAEKHIYHFPSLLSFDLTKILDAHFSDNELLKENDYEIFNFDFPVTDSLIMGGFNRCESISE